MSNIGIIYQCHSWDKKTINRAIFCAIENNQKEEYNIYIYLYYSNVDAPSPQTIKKHIAAAGVNVNRLVVIEDLEGNNIDLDLACCVNISPNPAQNLPRPLKAQTYKTIIHFEELEEFDWSN